jgi:hypothetical protein
MVEVTISLRGSHLEIHGGLFRGLILASWIRVQGLLVLAWAGRQALENHPAGWFSSTTCVRGFPASALALILSFAGKESARIPHV